MISCDVNQVADNLSSHEASIMLVQAAITFTRQHPGLLSRLGLIWPHIFTSMARQLFFDRVFTKVQP
jgi:hypothetical protein